MSEYMKGYNARNQKRRSSYIKQSRQTGRSAYRNRRRKRRGGGWNYQLIAEAVVGVAVIALLVVAGRSLLLNMNSGSSNTASGAATGSVTEAVAAVKTISVSAIAAPTPTPRPKAVALTFDDGPSTVNTPKILDILEKYNAHATFFVLGNRAAAGADVLKREVALGCEIGSHSWDHTNLSSLKMPGVNKQNSKTIGLVKKLTGYDVKIMRPPYGAISDVMRKKLKMPMILWSLDTLDWKSKDADKVFKQIKKNVSDGDIILVHDIHPSTAEAMKKVIPWLQENGYDILTVSELMERKGKKIKNGIAYGSVR